MGNACSVVLARFLDDEARASTTSQHGLPIPRILIRFPGLTATDEEVRYEIID